MPDPLAQDLLEACDRALTKFRPRTLDEQVEVILRAAIATIEEPFPGTFKPMTAEQKALAVLWAWTLEDDPKRLGGLSHRSHKMDQWIEGLAEDFDRMTEQGFVPGGACCCGTAFRNRANPCAFCPEHGEEAKR